MVSSKTRLVIWILLALVTLVSLAACSPIDPNAATGAGQDQPPAGMPFDPNSTVYDIKPGESTARFYIDEILRGEEKRVVGETGLISGQIAVNLEDPPSAAVGPIKVDARTLVTDNNFRNRAIVNRILLATIYEYVVFTPTAVTGLPDAISLGEAVQFQVAGDLTITTITKPVVFAVTADPLSADRLEGSAVAVINRDDFDLSIPSATGVAGVSEEVTLELDFVAVKEE